MAKKNFSIPSNNANLRIKGKKLKSIRISKAEDDEFGEADVVDTDLDVAGLIFHHASDFQEYVDEADIAKDMGVDDEVEDLQKAIDNLKKKIQKSIGEDELEYDGLLLTSHHAEDLASTLLEMPSDIIKSLGIEEEVDAVVEAVDNLNDDIK